MIEITETLQTLLPKVSSGSLGQSSWFLSENNETYVCGNNEYGQLGLGHTTHQNVPQKLTSPAIGNKKIISLSSGARHTAFITEDGRLYTFGHNDKGQLGHTLQQDRVGTPVLINNNNKFVSVSCGNNHTLVLSSDGALFSFGSNDCGQLGVVKSTGINKLDLKQNIIGISCGFDHSVALTDSGILYTWGCGSSGQLGLNHTQNVNTPQHVTCINDRIVKVSCGYMHTACLSASGDLFVFGFLHNDVKFGPSGKKVKSFPTNDPVVSLASGSTHILALTARGDVYGMGVNGHGQLAIEGKIIADVQQITPLRGKGIKEVVAGFQHSLALTSTGQVFAFGRNERGQLGVGHNKAQPTPAIVTIPGVKRIIDIFHLSQQAPLKESGNFVEEEIVLPPPPLLTTQYHADYNLQFPQPAVQEETTISLPPPPQSFTIVGKKH